MQLAQAAFENACKFIKDQARSLEQARLAYYFEDGSAEDILSALATFQNADGGFGHGLEPDVRSPHSSVICTSIAFQILRSLQVPVTHELVKTGLNYLLAQYNSQTVHWRTIPPVADQSPHAPWWSNAASERYDDFSLNPTAEILGYLYDYADSVPAELITTVTAKVLETVQASDRLEMHDLLCCWRLVQTETLSTANGQTY